MPNISKSKNGILYEVEGTNMTVTTTIIELHGKHFTTIIHIYYMWHHESKIQHTLRKEVGN